MLTALGFPIVSILINLTDTLNRLLDRGLTMRQIAISYVYSVPENMFLVHAGGGAVRDRIHRRRHGAALRAHGRQGRWPELPSAACVPIFIAVGAGGRARRGGGRAGPGGDRAADGAAEGQAGAAYPARFNFVYRGDEGWVYTIQSLEVATRKLKQVLFERQGTGLDYPGLVITADSASYDDSESRCVASLERGQPGHCSARPAGDLRVPNRCGCGRFTQAPADLLAEPKAPDEMRYAELGRYIEALERSGNDANKLMVERALKLAIPATCLIIAVFGAPLAVTSPRAGAAFGIAISLGTTVMFLLLMQISEGGGCRRRRGPCGWRRGSPT